MNIFWGMQILWIFFGGHHKNGLVLISNIFLGMPDIPDIFGGKQ